MPYGGETKNVPREKMNGKENDTEQSAPYVSDAVKILTIVSVEKNSNRLEGLFMHFD